MMAMVPTQKSSVAAMKPRAKPASPGRENRRSSAPLRARIFPSRSSHSPRTAPRTTERMVTRALLPSRRPEAAI